MIGKVIAISVIGGGIVLGGTAIYYYRRQLALLQDLSYEVIGVKYAENYDPKNPAFTLTIRIFSKSTLDAQVKSLDVDVYFNGVKQLVVKSASPFIIPAQGYSDAQLTVTTSLDLLAGDMAGLIGGLVGGLTGGKGIIIKLDGFIRIKEVFLTISVPFTYATSLNQILQA